MNNQEIQPYLRTKIFGSEIFAFDLIDSTNLKAKALAREGVSEGTIVIAEEQTAGRGRLDRPWFSERGKNLTFSLIIKPRIKIEYNGVLSLYAGLAVAQAIQNVLHVIPQCKWPNDVLLGDKKLCGILSEAILMNGILEGVIIGIGINVNQTFFPEEIKQTATSLSLNAGKQFNRFEVLAAVLERLEILYGDIQKGLLKNILDGWKRYCSIFGKEILVSQNGQIIKGIATGLDEDGGLLMQTKNSEIKILAGDITLCC